MIEVFIFLFRLACILITTAIAVWARAFVKDGAYIHFVLWGSFAYFFADYLKKIYGFRIFRGGEVKETPEIIWKFLQSAVFV